ncbi:MAG: hypothetical protein WCX31_03430 [Salinivirgaceae bacterium]
MKKNKTINLLIGLFSILLIFLIFNLIGNIEINLNRGVTLGKIISYEPCGKSGMCITYIYQVNNLDYKAEVSVGKKFDTTDMGKEFYVEYSTKNPHKNRILIYKKSFYCSAQLPYFHLR